MTAGGSGDPLKVTGFRRGLVMVLLAVGLLHLPNVCHDFVNWDDDAYVRRNPDISRPNLRAIWSPDHLIVSDWTPIVALSHMVEYQLGGLRPSLYHATNVLLHVLSVALVALLLRRIGCTLAEALLAALLFGMHPLQVESVAWISARKNLLAAVFGLAFLLRFIAGRPVSATAWLLLALGSKGTAVIFPLWAAACVYWRVVSPRLRQPMVWLALFAALALERGVLSVHAQAGVSARTAVLGLSQRMAITGPILAMQLRQFIAPYDLASEYGWEPLAWADGRVLGAWGLVVLVAASAIAAARANRQTALAAFFCASALLPTANLWPGPYLQADRYLHLALVGAVVLAVRLAQPLRRLHARLPVVVLLLWCAAVGAPFTVWRSAVWKNGGTLWSDVVRRVPYDGGAWLNLAGYYQSIGDIDAATTAYRQGIAASGDPRLYYDFALGLAAAGRRGEAENELRALIETRPDHAPAHARLGEMLAADGQVADGLKELTTALDLNPGLWFARASRARLLTATMHLDEAETDLTVLVAQPRVAPGVWADFAELRRLQGRNPEAIALAQQGIAADPALIDGWLQFAKALAADGQTIAAEAALQRGVSQVQDPDPLLAELGRLQQR